MICTVQPPNMRALPPTASPAPATSLPLLQLHELLRLFPLWLLLAKRPLLCPWPSPLPMSLCAVVVRLLVARAAWAVAAVSVMERTVVVMGGAASALGGVAAPLLQPLWSLPQPCGVVLGGCMRAPLELLFLVCGPAAVVLQLLPHRQQQRPPRLPLALALVRVALGSAARAQMPYLASRVALVTVAHPGVSAGAPPPVGSVAALPSQLTRLFFFSSVLHWPAPNL